MRNLKIDIRQDNEVLSFKSGNQPCVTNDVMFAYAYEKRNILLFVLIDHFVIYLF